MYWNIAPFSVYSNCIYRLTLTWDVLKSPSPLAPNISGVWLTLTWDVLKFNKAGDNSIPKKRLTLTWDVLKWDSNSTSD